MRPSETDSPFSIRHDFLYLGKHLHFQGCGVESQNMTALVSVYTDEGFVFGADGRRLDPDRKLERDDTQKIFGCHAANLRALFGWSGHPILGTSQHSFDFRLNTLATISAYEKEHFKNLIEYAETIADAMNILIQTFMTRTKAGLDPRCEELARLAMVGYVNGKPQSVRMILSANKGTLNPSRLDQAHNPPVPAIEVTSGHKSVYDSMVESGQMLPCSTLVDGCDLIRKYIHGCTEVPTEDINTIGGHIHIAAVTPAGSQWMVPPKP